MGNYRNFGRTWEPSGQPACVKVHDFPDPKLGKAIPYGVYDLRENAAFVSVGIDHDTSAFATTAIHRWWRRMGRVAYPEARELLIMADGGGSNGVRCRLWKAELPKLSDRLRMTIRVCHFPPGTSKWNRIEHCLFSPISINWRGVPLTSGEWIVQLIGATTTRSGLVVKAAVDSGNYSLGLKVTEDEWSRLRCERDTFHGEWNYRIMDLPTFCGHRVKGVSSIPGDHPC